MFNVTLVKFSDMKNKDIVDSKNETIGRVIDFHFILQDRKIIFKSVVMGGSRIEEFLERIGAKPDIDPFFSLDLIDRYENGKLYLNVPYEKLSEPVKLGENEKLLSDLGKYKIIDYDGNNIGKIRDVIFDEKARPWFVVEGGFFEETFEKLGIRPDIDPLVPPEFFDEMTKDKITLKHNKMTLVTTAEREWQEHKRQLAIDAQITKFQHQFLFLHDLPAQIK
jgi:sporulation protein YlmC with PRC-barrel domain